MVDNKKHFKEALEDEAEGCDDQQVETRPGEEFQLLRFCFNITNMDIRKDFLKV